MDKQAFLEDIHWPTALKAGKGGLLTGGGIAGLLSLAHMVRQAHKAKQRAEEKEEQGTITLTLPSKESEDNKKPVKIEKTETGETKLLVGLEDKHQPRRTDGTLGEKTAQDTSQQQPGWFDWSELIPPVISGGSDNEAPATGVVPWLFGSGQAPAAKPSSKNKGTSSTLLASWLLGGAGLIGGGMLVNSIYRKIREKRLEKELEEAQQEYMDMLQHGSESKAAQALDELVPDKGIIKNAGGDDYSFWDYALSTGGLLGILGLGGTAWLTKKILDAKLQEVKSRGLDIPESPKVKRIVFRTQDRTKPEMKVVEEKEDEDIEKGASAEDYGDARAALGVMLDRVGPRTRALDSEYAKDAMRKGGNTVRGLFKASQDAGELMTLLRRNPYLSAAIQRNMMDAYPMLWSMNYLPGAKSPGGGATAGNSPDMETLRSLSKSSGAASNILTSLVGSSIAERTAPEDEEKEVEERMQPEKVDASKIELEAEGSGAEEYLDKNRQQILILLRKLQETGKL